MRLSRGSVNPQKDRARSPSQQPRPAPAPPIRGPHVIEKKAGITTPGLKCPTPQGVGIGEVTAIPAAYRIAETETKEIFRAGLTPSRWRLFAPK